MPAAMPEARAVAALVSLMRVKYLPSLISLVVSSEYGSGQSTHFPSGASTLLPPSMTRSGLNGHLLSHMQDVELHGLSPPFLASGWCPSYSAGSGNAFSVYAPMVRAFHAWPGSWMPSVS